MADRVIPPITQEQIAVEAARARHAIIELDKLRPLLVEKARLLDELLIVQQDLDGAPSVADIPDGIGVKLEGTPDTEILEMMLRRRGPMHISDIIAEGRKLGVAFVGKTNPKQIARAKLSSSNRFENLGSNRWRAVE